MSKIIGIDLGTTRSVATIIEKGKPTVITTVDGSRLTPSMVAFDKSGGRLVGQTARQQASTNPANTVFSVKRFIGRRFDDDETAADKACLPYAIAKGSQGDIRIEIPQKGHSYTPQEISAMVLSKLKKDAENYLGEPVTKAVITVPAYFSDSQRQATKDAGKIAGLDVLRLISEPMAAALAYGVGKTQDELILLFDLGGGTFDVSVLQIWEGVVEVLATSGDTHLGGDDWDMAIADWMISDFLRNQGIDLRQDRPALQRVREAAEKAKIGLSGAMQTEINLPSITTNASGPKHLQMILTRSKFEQLTESLLRRMEEPVKRVLADANIETGVLDAVVLVGGSTRMPMVQEAVRRLTGQEPHKSVNPDEVVALGAALQGNLLTGNGSDMLLLDVAPLSLGLEMQGGAMVALIPRNTTIPTRRSEVFSTSSNNQQFLDVPIFQGEQPMARDNNMLGVLQIAGILPAARGIPQIEVTFNIDANGILDVTAREIATGVNLKSNMMGSTNLNAYDISRLAQEI